MELNGLTKYISFKIFDSKDHPDNFDAIRKKQTDKYYTIVHEDYYIGIIKAELERNNRDPEYWVKLSEEIGKAEAKAVD